MSMDFERMAASMDDFLKSYQEAQNEAGRYRGYASKLIEARNELDAANEKCLRLQDDCERFARVNDSLIVENEVLKKKLDQAEEFWENIIRELQNEVNQLKAENDRLRERGGSYVSDNESLQAKLKHTEMVWREETKALNAEIDRLNKELDEERKQHSDIAASWSADQCECNRLQTEIVWLREKGAKLQEYSDSQDAKLKHVELLFSVAKAENERLKAELADERDRFDRLQDFEVAEAKELEQLRAEVKRDERIYNTIMDLLEQDGYDTMSLFFNTGYIVAQMELEEENDRR